MASYRVKDSTSSLPLLLLCYWKNEHTDYRVRVVAKAAYPITNLRLLSKVLRFYDQGIEIEYYSGLIFKEA